MAKRSLCGLEFREVDKLAPPTRSTGSLVSGQDVSLLEHNTDELALATHPLFLVESNIAGCCREDGMVASNSDLEKRLLSMRLYPWTCGRRAYVLTWMEQGPSLSDNNVARNHKLV